MIGRPYSAIVANTILRFTWILYLTPGPSVPLRGFIVSLTEVFRRFVWSFFRLESEQVGVADSYRVTRDVPLPFGVSALSFFRCSAALKISHSGRQEGR